MLPLERPAADGQLHGTNGTPIGVGVRALDPDGIVGRHDLGLAQSGDGCIALGKKASCSRSQDSAWKVLRWLPPDGCVAQRACPAPRPGPSLRPRAPQDGHRTESRRWRPTTGWIWASRSSRTRSPSRRADRRKVPPGNTDNHPDDARPVGRTSSSWRGLCPHGRAWRRRVWPCRAAS